MATSNFNMKLDEQTKEQFGKLVSEYGLTIPQAFKLFAHQAIQTGVLPLSFDYKRKNYIPNASTQQAMIEAIAERPQAKRYDNLEDMMHDIMEQHHD